MTREAPERRPFAIEPAECGVAEVGVDDLDRNVSVEVAFVGEADRAVSATGQPAYWSR